jgi:hypothetical protein
MVKTHKSRSKKRMKHTEKNHSQYDFETTYQHLIVWYKEKFEKLGWMILAKKYGMMDKVLEYQNSIQRLYHSICKKIKSIHDKDTKADLLIMKKNVEYLLEHVKKDFS